MAWSSTTVDVSHMHLSLVCVRGIHVCIKACVLLEAQQVFWCWDVLPTLGIVQKALGKRNGFGDDVVAQQPPHPCLVVHNTVCHVTPCVFPFSEPRMEQCSSQERLLCLWCQCFHVQSNCLGKHLPLCSLVFSSPKMKPPRTMSNP